jgi:hypothetical protein
MEDFPHRQLVVIPTAQLHHLQYRLLDDSLVVSRRLDDTLRGSTALLAENLTDAITIASEFTWYMYCC